MALNIKRAERVVEVCLDGTLTADWELTRRRVQELLEEAKRLGRQVDAQPKDDRLNRRKTPAEKRMAEVETELAQLSQEAEALADAAIEQTALFRLRALPRPVWDELVTEHPARPAVAGAESPDAPFPFNKDTIADAALALDESIVSVTRKHDGAVEEFSATDWPAFAAELSDSQHGDFRATVIQLNVGSNDLPFFRASDSTRGSAKR